MSRKLASVQTIAAVEPIEKADTLEVVRILGWQSGVRKGDFKVGDKVVYFEVDSFLPIAPQYEFLRKNCYKNHPEIGEGFRLRTIKLRGQISQGLVMKLNEVGLSDDWEVGDDVTDALKVKLYAPPIPACLKGKIKGSFPSFIPKTDETRVQVLQPVLTRYKGEVCYVTEKIDGTSVTYYLRDGVFGICARNIEVDPTDEHTAYVEIAKKYDIEKKMRTYVAGMGPVNFAIQGEIYGLGIQGNSMKISEHRVAFFNVFLIDEYAYLDFNDFRYVMDAMDLPIVPVLQTSWALTDNVEELLKMAQGKSRINPEVEREGIVIRPIYEKLDLEMSRGLGNGRLSFKAVSEKYLLECEQ